MERPFEVSTITCNGSVGSANIDLAVFFEHARVAPAPGGPAASILFLKFGDDATRGEDPGHRRSRATKKFENQITVVLHLPGDGTDSPGSCINAKLFRNGRVQSTGSRTIEAGARVLAHLADEIRWIAAHAREAVVDDVARIGPCEFRVSMINSNFTAGYKIRRRTLQNLVTSDPYNMRSFFGGVYPAVKIAFYYNDANTVQGICACGGSGGDSAGVCSGKGRGRGRGDCKRVTIAVFESGATLITGGNAFEQIEAAHRFAAALFVEHRDVLQKLELLGPEAVAARPR